MTSQIEIFDERRRKYRGGLILGSLIFFLAWIGYVIYRISEQELELLHKGLLTILIISVLFQAYFAIRYNLLEKKIREDPFLKEALHNELVRLNELKAWRASFFSVIGFIILAAVASIFVQINDLMLVFLTALLIGFGTHNVAVYLFDR
jgi:hypothetical protein